MGFDITVKHPDYIAFAPAWELMRDAYDGEDCVKAKGEKYLPMKSGTAAIQDERQKLAAYNAYRMRAEFPELVAPTVRGSVGIILKQSATIELPKSMEFLREKATRDGLPLDAFHRRIAAELLKEGRYGVLPGIDASGNPYLAGYAAESIINWDEVDGAPYYVVLNESGPVRDPETGAWTDEESYRECELVNGVYTSRLWTMTDKQWSSTDEPQATTRKRRPLNIFPFVFFGTNDLNAKPDDVPLYGLGKISLRIYRMDADYAHSLHMTSEPTPVVSGFSDPKSAKENNLLPTGIGSSTLWVLPQGGDAKFLEFTGAGIEAQKTAIDDALERAVMFGAQALANTSRAAESGDAIQLRLGNQYSLLHLIAINSAAGLEKALRNVAIWLGENPDDVKVKPNLEFFDKPLDAQTLTALVQGWQSGAYSYATLFDRLKRGRIVPDDRTEDDERKLITDDPLAPSDMDPSMILPNPSGNSDGNRVGEPAA